MLHLPEEEDVVLPEAALLERVVANEVNALLMAEYPDEFDDTEDDDGVVRCREIQSRQLPWTSFVLPRQPSSTVSMRHRFGSEQRITSSVVGAREHVD
jgi:hypothetical protein